MSAILAAGFAGAAIPNLENLLLSFTNTWSNPGLNYFQWDSDNRNPDADDPPPPGSANQVIQYLVTQPDTTAGNNVKAATRNDAGQFWRFDGSQKQIIYSVSYFLSNEAGWPARYLRNSFSFNIWFRYRDAGLGRKIIGCQSTPYQTSPEPGRYDRHFYVGTDRYLYWGAYNKFASAAQTVRSLGTLNANQWYFASVYLNDGTYFMFLDNIFQGTLSILEQDYNPLTVGLGGSILSGWPAAVSGNNQFWTGDIHSLYIYQSGVTGDTITDLYNATRNWIGKDVL